MYIKKYSFDDKILWDEFVKLAKNGHFFFFRDYMDYHADRFTDHSLLIYDDKNILIALLPANIQNQTLFSHQGLTFGGLLVKPSIKQVDVLNIFSHLRNYIKSNEIDKIIYKRIPYIYHSMPADEDLYALFRINAMLLRRDVSSAIDLNNQIKYSKGRKWIVKKTQENGLVYEEIMDAKCFWATLEMVLLDRHGVRPVHSYEEIEKLKNLFPTSIKFYGAYYNDAILAGAVIFEVKKTVHTQYLFNTELGRSMGALDGLIDYLVKSKYADMQYFDFGISNEKQGLILNEGLISQKEGFGARAITHDFYEISGD